MDIFCFQEVFDTTSAPLEYQGARPNLFKELSDLLPEFSALFMPTYYGWIDVNRVSFNISEGQAIFVKNEHKVLQTGQYYIYGDNKTEIQADFTNEPKDLIFAKISVNHKELLVINAHGKWFPGNKLDTADRLEQSNKINEFLKTFSIPKILCGDFNLDPETESIKILEKNLENLIKTHDIKSTRNQISWNKFANVQNFADYVFVSEGIKVIDFLVPYNEVSDHLPLILDFEI